ncbi:MAG: arsenate reductase ArsC [Syntrophobacterales bacterium]|nr:arsenate reductase ArsC [Syntrophobacterales bacterium]
MEREKVLFVCVHNSARSQMAEALMNHLCGDRFEAKSAGLEPGLLNPLVVRAMAEIGIDISENKTKGVFDFLQTGELFSLVVTVCDEASAERCPFFPGVFKRLHWGFPDPSQISGTQDEKLEAIRKIRDDIKNRIMELCATR